MQPDTLCIDTTFGSRDEQQDCSSCCHISLAVVVSIAVCDILLTIFIALSIFFVVRSHSNTKRELPDARTPSKEMSAEATESPYQELQGPQSDVYCELDHFRT
ncbi:unnamed protein product [Knipowitschia caucasica]|uniref:TYRO protein tyrosine kinase-binding protein n=1 Tax=Knipowitschia caucasica TaxID=637954 RepID=A0AAV2MDB1_KNICA